MADQKISQLTEVTELAATDELVVVDKSDTSMAGSGTTKRVTRDNVRASVAYEALNVKWPEYGAVGDGVTDDTAAIQAAIDAAVTARATGGDIFFPPGQYVVTSTLTFPSPSGGGRVVGSGVYLDDPQTDAVAPDLWGPQTLLIWDGAVGGTMIEQAGSIGWIFEHMTFVGRPAAADSNRAGIGYLCSYVAGAASGVGAFEHCAWYDFAVAVQMAELSTDNNCADMVFEKCKWVRCDKCLYVKNLQGLNYRFEQPGLETCSCFVHCEEGGSVQINMLNTSLCDANATGDWLLRFDDMVPNVGACIVNGWRVEQGTKGLVKAGHMGNVVINGLEEAQADQNVTQFHTVGAHLTIRTSRLTSNDATNPAIKMENSVGGHRAMVVLDQVNFDVSSWTFGNWLKSNDTNDIVALQVENCTLGELADQYLPNIGSHFEYGPVTHFVQTTDANAKATTLDGTGTESWWNAAHIPPNSTWLIDAVFVGQEVGGGGDIGVFNRRAVFKNVAGTVTLVGALQTIGTDVNTDAWGGVDLQARDGNDGFIAAVTGKASTTINWKVRMVGTRADAIG